MGVKLSVLCPKIAVSAFLDGLMKIDIFYIIIHYCRY